MLGACALGVVITACGAGVRTKVVSAMEGCLAVRNPLFKAGRSDEALATRLPAAVVTLAEETAYEFGFRAYREVADAAETQAELTCALELGAHYEHEDVRAWLLRFTRSPDVAVATLATHLSEAQSVRSRRDAKAKPASDSHQ